MKRKLLSIYSSSFIFEKSNLWNGLLPDHFKVKFNHFNNFSDIFFEKKNEYIVIIIFLEDLNYINKSFLKSYLSNVEQACLKASSSNSKILFFYSTWSKRNLLNQSKIFFNYEKSLIFFKNFIYKKICKINNTFIFNLDDYFGEFGFNNIFDQRNWYLLKCRLSLDGTKTLIKCIQKVILEVETKKKKILVVDCDNTIWGGIIGEIGISNLKLGTDGEGSIFSDIQKQILQLSKKGILLAIISKNNEEDVMNVFKNHNEMILKENHFVNIKINWKDKYQNIKLMSKELDLHISNFAFLDDNPLEREQMKNNVPEVEVIDPPKEIHNWPNFISNLKIFSTPYILENDKKRNSQYKSRMKFINDKKDIFNNVEFLKQIKIKPKLVKLNRNLIQRAIQLSQRTNQFNLVKNEYNHDEINNLLKNKEDIFYLLSLKDKYGDHGIVGLFHIKKITNDEYKLHNFLLSCRVLGRQIEYWLLNVIKKILYNKSFKLLNIEPIDTGKNKISINFIKTINMPIGRNKKSFVLTNKIKIPHLEIFDNE